MYLQVQVQKIILSKIILYLQETFLMLSGPISTYLLLKHLLLDYKIYVKYLKSKIISNQTIVHLPSLTLPIKFSTYLFLSTNLSLRIKKINTYSLLVLSNKNLLCFGQKYLWQTQVGTRYTFIKMYFQSFVQRSQIRRQVDKDLDVICIEENNFVTAACY